MTGLVEQGNHLVPSARVPRVQVARRVLAVVLMDAAALVGLLFAFPDWGEWASSAGRSTSDTGPGASSAPILLVGTGVLVAVVMVVPSVLLARRVWLRSGHVSWSTIGLSGVVMLTTIVQANSIWVLLCFLSSGVLMTFVGLPLSA